MEARTQPLGAAVLWKSKVSEAVGLGAGRLSESKQWARARRPETGQPRDQEVDERHKNEVLKASDALLSHATSRREKDS